MKQSYRIDELEKFWKISRRTILRLIYAKKLNAFKVGAYWRIRAEEIERYEKNRPTRDN